MYIEQFIAYLKNEKKMAPNSLDAYGRDAVEEERLRAAAAAEAVAGD